MTHQVDIVILSEGVHRLSTPIVSRSVSMSRFISGKDSVKMKIEFNREGRRPFSLSEGLRAL